MARETMHTATERWYLTKDDKPVKASEVGALLAEERVGLKLLVGAGSAIPLKTAEHYGLLAPPEPEQTEEPVDLESQTKAELLAIAEEKGVEVRGSMTKADLIEAIEAAE